MGGYNCDTTQNQHMGFLYSLEQVLIKRCVSSASVLSHSYIGRQLQLVLGVNRQEVSGLQLLTR